MDNQIDGKEGLHHVTVFHILLPLSNTPAGAGLLIAMIGLLWVASIPLMAKMFDPESRAS